MLLEVFHGEIGPLVGRALVSAAEPTPESLSPRLRQTLACLVEGDTEKQVAARLGVSHATVHEYVTALYRRFGVNSRAQLLAHVLKRVARREWREGLNL
jgi:DNA-binding NarL/FixJ family response regulator